MIVQVTKEVVFGATCGGLSSLSLGGCHHCHWVAASLMTMVVIGFSSFNQAAHKM